MAIPEITIYLSGGKVRVWQKPSMCVVKVIDFDNPDHVADGIHGAPVFEPEESVFDCDVIVDEGTGGGNPNDDYVVIYGEIMPSDGDDEDEYSVRFRENLATSKQEEWREKNLRRTSDG